MAARNNSVKEPQGRRIRWLIFGSAVALVAAMLVWQGLTEHGNPAPVTRLPGSFAAIMNIGVLVFREGLECILVLAAITASMTGPQQSYQYPVAQGAGVGFLATLVTWFIAVRILDDISMKISALNLQAATGLLAIVVLLIVMNWFFHKMYWTGWISMHNRRKRDLLDADSEGSDSQRIVFGLGLLGFSSLYREGVEVVLFLQSYRLRLGSRVILYGVLIGLFLCIIVAVLTFVAHRRLPYRKMLVFTGVMLGVVLFVMTGEQIQEMQLGALAVCNKSFMACGSNPGMDEPVVLGLSHGREPINGRIICKDQIETRIPDGRVAVLQRVFKCVHGVMEASRVPRDKILGAGIAHSGVIDAEKGMVISFPRPGQMAEWKNVPLRDLFGDEFKVPCMLEDSVRTMAIAERYFGLGREVGDFLFIEVGMGIGAAIFVDGKLYRGAGGKAGEFGHITALENGPLCSCGNTGCLESVASCASIIQSVRVAVERGVDSKVRDLAAGDLSQITVEKIAQAAMENDGLAFRVLQEAASYIAMGLADLVNVLNPRLVIFGGALFGAAPELVSDPLKRLIRQRSLEKSADDAELRVSPLGAESGALGASRMIAGQALEWLYTH